MSLSKEEYDTLQKLLKKQQTQEGKNPENESAIADAEDTEAQVLKQLEIARKKVEFLKVGPLGDIADGELRDKAWQVLKKLQELETLLSGKHQALAAAWFKDKKNADFLAQAEAIFSQLTGAIVDLVSRFDLGGYKEQAEKMQAESRKRQRQAEELPAKCTCGSRKPGADDKWASVPLRQE